MRKVFVIVAMLTGMVSTMMAQDLDAKYATDLLPVGTKAPDLVDAKDSIHHITDFRGRCVVLDFWATWCGDCRKDLPEMKKLHQIYDLEGVEFIGISFDNKKDAWVKAVGQLNLPWLQLSDLKGWQCAAAPIYKIDAIPDNILIDPQGKIIDRALRGKSLHNRLQQIFDKQ